LFFATAVCIAGAIVSRCGRPVPVLAFGLLTTGGLGAYSWFMFVDQNLAWRLLSVNFALGGIILVGAAELRAIPHKTTMQWIMFVLSLLAGLNFFARTLVVVYVDSPPETYEGFYRSSYWTTVMLTHAIVSITSALTLIASITLDMIAELRSEAQTDGLSALLNRRGFEEQSTKMLADAAQRGLPVSLVICDLDHFKAVNDSLGHAAGDLVISAFARFLRKAVPAHHAVGRIGGEEFAILLAGTNLPAARLLAEGARSAFGALAIGGLPEHRRFTASFGVAELAHGESIIDLLARADAALYVAKREGRNCVRVARPSFTLPSSASRTGRQIDAALTAR
jgi:diguanylate cyclase (GGDEF)-like protein